MRNVKLFLIALLFLTTHIAFGQWSIKADGEYMFPLAQTQIYPNVGYYYPQRGPLSGTYGTLGKGISTGVAVNYTFKSNITLELGGQYWYGSTYTNTYNSPGSGSTESYSSMATQNLRLFIVSPSIIYKITTASKFTPYIGVGIDVALGGKENQSGTYSTSTVGDTIAQSFTASGSSATATTYLVSIGANGQLGVSYKLSNHFSVFANLRFDILSLMPSIQTLTSETNNGAPVDISTLPAFEKQIVYVKSLQYNYVEYGSNTNEEIAQTTPVSTWGITIGVEFKFGSKNK